MAEMKSAVELAMEKLGKLQSDDSPAALSDEQRQQIHDLRQLYDAKIAEKEIMMQSELRKLIQSRAPQEAAMAAHGLQEQFQAAKKSLQQEMEEKITAIRSA